ncbi:hypothetical protein DBV15_08573 [Temnothorax longispinosus]|uniref:Uncharacterized protein n=1 Tax=Temnothorax longispinosus TaxID=300112 RepID=A0A4S2KZ60_9HYME|nr:hypothetical protein DBV15_08573 [Temnothorax longispinosus]
MTTSCRSKQESAALSGIWKSPEGLKGPLNDVEEARGGCLLVLRHNLLVFITDDARELLSFSLSSSTAILRHLYFRRLAPFLRFYPESSALVFRRNTINHLSQSAGMTPPLHPRLSSKRACFVNDESFRLPDECVIIQVTIILKVLAADLSEVRNMSLQRFDFAAESRSRACRHEKGSMSPWGHPQHGLLKRQHLREHLRVLRDAVDYCLKQKERRSNTYKDNIKDIDASSTNNIHCELLLKFLALRVRTKRSLRSLEVRDYPFKQVTRDRLSQLRIKKAHETNDLCYLAEEIFGLEYHAALKGYNDKKENPIDPMFTRFRVLSLSRSRWREPISDPSKPSCTLQPAATPANIGNGGDVEERRSGCAVTKACATHLDLDAHIVNQLQRDPVTFEVPIHSGIEQDGSRLGDWDEG